MKRIFSRCINEKSMKNASEINLNSIKNEPNIDQKPPKIEIWRHLGGVLEASMGVLGRLGSILSCLGEFRAVLGASWSYLERVLGASWGRLGPSWNGMGASRKCLGVSLGHLGSSSGGHFLGI